MIEQRSDVMHKQRVKLLRDLFLIGEIQRTFEGNPVRSQRVSRSSCSANLPNTLQVHGSNFDHVSRLLALQNTITTTSGHTSDIQKFCAVNEMVV